MIIARYDEVKVICLLSPGDHQARWKRLDYLRHQVSQHFCRRTKIFCRIGIDKWILKSKIFSTQKSLGIQKLCFIHARNNIRTCTLYNPLVSLNGNILETGHLRNRTNHEYDSDLPVAESHQTLPINEWKDVENLTSIETYKTSYFSKILLNINIGMNGTHFWIHTFTGPKLG